MSEPNEMLERVTKAIWDAMDLTDGLDIEAAERYARAAIAAVQEWQPIATAPRDGTEILIYVPGSRSEVSEARWMTPFVTAPDDRCWWQVGAHIVRPESPTHWMPMPSPPQS